MADPQQQCYPEDDISMGPHEEATDQGCFNFLVRRKEDKAKEDLTDGSSNGRHQQSTHSHIHSRSSSEEEVEAERERNKKQNEVKEKVASDNEVAVDDEIDEHIDAGVPMEKYIAEEHAKAVQMSEKKGFIEKMKDKLPSQIRSSRDEESPKANDTNDKKGILDKILDKLPGSGQNKTNATDV